MADTQEEVIQDNSDIDLSGIEVGYPIFDNQTVDCMITAVQTVRNDGRKSKRITLVTEGDITSTGGATKTAGFKLTDRIGLDVSGGRTQERINEDLTKFQIAALGITKGQKWSDEDFAGKHVRVSLKARPDRNDADKFYQNVRYSKAS